MMYLAKLIALIDDDPKVEERVKDAVRKAGGCVRLSESKQTSVGTKEQLLTFEIGRTTLLPEIVKAVEGVRGAGVMAVTEPRMIRDLKPH